jgi:tRNA pseudouridine55 synthase
MQRPPAFSAVKIAGRRAYDIARHAPEALPSPEPRPVLIESIAMLSYDWPLLHLDIACGKGTYIRSLARDLGAALGAGGMLRSLVRTRVGPWTIDQAARPEALPDPLTQAHLLRPADAPAGP